MDDRLLLTRDDMADRYHISPRRVSELVRDFAVPVLRPGKVMLFDEKAIHAFEDACRARAHPPESTTSVALPSAHSGPRVPRPGSAFASALARIDAILQKKKPVRPGGASGKRGSQM